MFWVYASELCEKAFNCLLRTFGLSVRLTFSHTGILSGQISKIVLPNFQDTFLNYEGYGELILHILLLLDR